MKERFDLVYESIKNIKFVPLAIIKQNFMIFPPHTTVHNLSDIVEVMQCKQHCCILDLITLFIYNTKRKKNKREMI